MAYTPNEWESGDVVTATKLNSLEQAVGELNMSYTPNNWSDGDVLSAAKMNALEQAVASGGGGGDFSTATVTVTVEADVGNGLIELPALIDEEGFTCVVPNIPISSGETATYTVPLYKGAVYVINSAFYRITTSGNIEADGEASYIITGDCTINVLTNVLY